MSRSLLTIGAVAWAGFALLIGETAWARRKSLADRVAPYLPGSGAGSSRTHSTLTDVIGPLVEALGENVSRLLGVDEPLDERLSQLHSTDTPSSFRLRQAMWCLASCVTGLAVSLAVGAPSTVVGLFVLGSPVLAFLIMEQHSMNAVRARQAKVASELPVVAEQLAMLLSAGWSLGASLARLAERSDGACGQDLRRVLRRNRQGLSLDASLKEWAEVSNNAGIGRLVSILALNHEAADIGRLVTEEARNLRRELQRDVVEQIEKRSQLVWIPVTLATLVPGVIFLCIPFINALEPFTS